MNCTVDDRALPCAVTPGVRHARSSVESGVLFNGFTSAQFDFTNTSTVAKFKKRECPEKLGYLKCGRPPDLVLSNIYGS